MALFADRCLETSTSTGAGAITLAGAVTGYRAFSVGHLVGELVSYAWEGVDANGAPTGEWETGLGTLTNATTITRHFAFTSSNANAIVTMSAGTKRVWSNANAFLLGDEFSTSSAAQWMPAAASTVVPGVYGTAAVTALGTVTLRSTATTNRFTKTSRLGYVSAATAGAFCGHYSTIAARLIGNGTDGGFVSRVRFGCSDTSAVSGARMFVGLRNSVAAPTNVEPNTLTNAFGVAQLSTGTNLQIVQGGSAAQTAVDLGVNFPAAGLSTDLYELTMISPRHIANVVAYNLERKGTTNVVSGLFPNATPGTTMPANTLFLAVQTAWRTNNATLLACGLDIAGFGSYTDF